MYCNIIGVEADDEGVDSLITIGDEADDDDVDSSIDRIPVPVQLQTVVPLRHVGNMEKMFSLYSTDH